MWRRVHNWKCFPINHWQSLLQIWVWIRKWTLRNRLRQSTSITDHLQRCSFDMVMGSVFCLASALVPWSKNTDCYCCVWAKTTIKTLLLEKASEEAFLHLFIVSVLITFHSSLFLFSSSWSERQFFPNAPKQGHANCVFIPVGCF